MIDVFEKIGGVAFIVFLIIVGFSIKGCQCDLRAGNGIISHYNPFLGCVFEQQQ